MTAPRDVRGFASPAEHARLLLGSYRALLGRELLDGLLPGGRERFVRAARGGEETSARHRAEDGGDLANRLFHAPLFVLSHGTEPDPVLNFGSAAALRLWERDWASFTSLPSRLTAEPMERAARDAFMRRVKERGYVDDYTGVRVSASGRRFAIRQAVVWNITDDEGRYRGQAAVFGAYDALP